ncbi:uncharacterized protein LOC120634995 [Pararge aegeria]|uniref:uncharacterized protein LOC120634995 n=1 Tax=Pararge aegeria TaxID=116150 RepID=UPI0019D1CE58|nr:uncharacterized protein LOC120634995 [Pararge aegeria]
MDLNLLQANINHCARAQDLLFQSMAQWSIHVAVVAEPYRVPSGDNWVGDTDGVVAMTSRSIVGSPAFVNVGRGRGYVSAFIDDVMVVGVYFSPSKSLADFEQFLAEVGVLISRRRSGRVLVAGDLNAKSVAWGCPTTNPRGRELEEWATASGLTVLNRGSVNTCVRQQGNVEEVEGEVARLGVAMSHVCDGAMRRVHSVPSKRAVYWWSEELTLLRRSCVAARRQYTRCRRRRRRKLMEEERLYSLYRDAVRLLRTAIGVAKDLA